MLSAPREQRIASRQYFAKGNRLLHALSVSDLRLLEADLIAVNLPRHQDLEKPNKKIENVYFLDSGIASVVAVHPRGLRIEVGIIGCEGMTGLAILHENDRTPHSTYMQISGSARRISAEKLAASMRQSLSLRQCMLKFAHVFCVQTGQTVAAGTKGTLPERLARWLLMTHDRVPGNELALTHDFLSLMLGVRRAGVTEALHSFAARKIVVTARKEITVVDRSALEKVAGSFYGIPEREYRRVVSEPVFLGPLLQESPTVSVASDSP